MTNNIKPVNTNRNDYSYGNLAKDVAAGFGVKVIANYSRRYGCSIFAKKLYNLNKSLSTSDKQMIDSVTDLVLGVEGLTKAGVRIYNITEKNYSKFQDGLINNINKSRLLKIFPFIKNHTEKRIERHIHNCISGYNASYYSGFKRIVISKENAILSFFHETGHAINHNCSSIWKSIHKLKKYKNLALPIFLIALLKSKKSDIEKPESVLDKSTSFIKNHAGKLTFLAFIPTLTDEAMASFRGNSIAKKLLLNNLSSKVKLASYYGFATYLISALATSISTYLAVKVKDK